MAVEELVDQPVLLGRRQRTHVGVDGHGADVGREVLEAQGHDRYLAVAACVPPLGVVAVGHSVPGVMPVRPQSTTSTAPLT
jgi:hypothetical protein